MKQLESGFKIRINWNKYQSKITDQTRNRNLDFVFFDPSFQGVNRLFVLSFEDKDVRKSYDPYFLPTVAINSCVMNAMIYGRNFFD